MIRLILALILGKTILFLTRFIKFGGGSAAPGYYALKLYPNLVQKLASQIPQNIIITGTNGKTTTSKLLAHFAKSQNFKIINNPTGSNLERGIASALIKKSNIFGSLKKFDIGIWELDEAAFNNVLHKLNPNLIVFLNIFRDQLDRYGEIDSIIKKWGESLKSFRADGLIILNGDDANISNLTKYFKGKVEKFGIEDYKISGESIIKQKETENLNYEAKKIKLNSLDSSNFELDYNGPKLEVTLPLPGIYHCYDFLAAFSTGYNLNLSPKEMIDSLTDFTPAFGRVEKFKLTNGKDGYIFLIKNPAGANQIFQTLSPEFKPEDKLLIALNDNFADGTDVSWIWDAQFEELTPSPSLRAKAKQSLQITNQIATSPAAPRNDAHTICSGTRAFDLALRLKYAGFKTEKIEVEPDLETAFNLAKKDLTGRLFVLPTYTAMLALQKILTKKGYKKHYWKEQV